MIQPQHFWADKHEARELAIMLGKLPTRYRVLWLKAVCVMASMGQKVTVFVTESNGEVKSVLADFWTICTEPLLIYGTALAEKMLNAKSLAEAMHGYRETLRSRTD
jgi:hypothetical protein